MGQSPQTRIAVIRHGETVWSSVGRQQGQLDTALNDRGVAQTLATADALAQWGVDVLYSSDLGRARQTAKFISERLGLEVLVDARLRERHLGIMQGLTMAEFQERYPLEHASLSQGDPDWVVPGGESARQRYERSVACACELAHRHVGKNIVIITHGGVVQSLFRYALGLSLEAPRVFSLYNASINVFSVTEGRWRLERWGDTCHLQMGTKDDG